MSQNYVKLVEWAAVIKLVHEQTLNFIILFRFFYLLYKLINTSNKQRNHRGVISRLR
jgi:hypothetical protein